jgi:hypothetical protein
LRFESKMPTAALPAFSGLSFFTVAVQQQQQGKGRLLPVPAVEQHVDGDEVDNDGCSPHNLLPCSRPGRWVQQAVQLTHDLGYAPKALAGVAAEAPRSKAERVIKKSSWSLLCQQIQPSAKQRSSTGAAPAQAAAVGAACANSPDAASATQCPQAPALALITASYVSSFSNSSRLATCTSPNSAGAVLPTTTITRGQPAVLAGLAAELVLEEPVITAADTVWEQFAHMQVRLGSRANRLATPCFFLLLVKQIGTSSFDNKPHGQHQVPVSSRAPSPPVFFVCCRDPLCCCASKAN